MDPRLLRSCAWTCGLIALSPNRLSVPSFAILLPASPSEVGMLTYFPWPYLTVGVFPCTYKTLQKAFSHLCHRPSAYSSAHVPVSNVSCNGTRRRLRFVVSEICATIRWLFPVSGPSGRSHTVFGPSWDRRWRICSLASCAIAPVGRGYSSSPSGSSTLSRIWSGTPTIFGVSGAFWIRYFCPSKPFTSLSCWEPTASAT